MTTKTPATPGTPKPARGRRAFDRDQALAVALREFWTHGYETTSIASLTKAMGINPPSLYAAFGDKRQLFTEAVALYLDTHAAPIEGPDARAAVERMLRHLAVDYTDPAHPPGCLVITAATNCGPASQEVKDELRALRERTKSAVADLIRADRALPAGADPDALAAFYAAVVQGMNQQACDGATRADLDRIVDTALTAWPAG